ncbi:MAG TPA: STAS domain-containing protein [Sphingomonadaceae bacterium]|nr:STAS domain-containing protein [Sphingomonadaceae bacterium]
MPQPQPLDGAALPEGGQPLKLPAHCGTTEAEDLRIRLVLACDVDGVIEIDAGEVESIGQAVLQLLVAAKAEAADSLPFTIVNPSPAFVDRITACRLGDAIGLTAEEEPVQ